VTRLQTGDGWKELPAWQEQLTLRMFAWSLVVGVPFTVIILKLSLTAGEKALLFAHEFCSFEDHSGRLVLLVTMGCTAS